MPGMISVRFKDGGKAYTFDAGEFSPKTGDRIVVETAQGMECGTCTQTDRPAEENPSRPVKKIIRVATAEDIQHLEDNRRREKEAFSVCEKKIAVHKLEMKLVGVEYTFDNSKLLFYFTADGRVDFRELVRDLASVFRTRIELRQVGVRDEAKMIGGLGICGREFCCTGFLRDFQPVSIKMAKEQNLSLNPVKISGTCGRLMCCLKYEQNAYEYLHRISPHYGAAVSTPKGRGVVTDVNLLTGKIKVQMDNTEGMLPETFDREEISPLADNKAAARKPAEPEK